MEITSNYLIGMDLGTTNIKAIIMSENGDVIASASRNNELIFPGTNMVEQNADVWWSNAVSIFKEMTTQVSPEIVKRICGISISSQTVTMLPVNSNGVPLRNAMIWMDSRSTKELEHIINTVGFDRLVSIIGAQPDVAFLPNKILWFRKNEPELFANTHQILQASSFINYKLTGTMSMDIDQAVRSQCLELKSLRWSEEIANAIGVNLDNILPDLKLTSEIIGTVTKQAAVETGLIEGIPVVAGASDASASMFATGLSVLGEAGESSGTTSLVFVGSDSRSATDIPVVTKPCIIDGMPFVFDAPINTSGAALKWYLDTFGQPEKDYAVAHNLDVYTHINEIALKDSVPGSGGVFFFPYLLGERAPLWNSYARGMFIGMSLNTTRADMIRSIFEGTAFALRHVMETIKKAGGKANCLRITGGGSKSRTWSLIKASMLRMPVHILDEKSGDVPFGDALIAGHALGVFPDLKQSMNRIVKTKEIIQPSEEWAQVYDRLYPYYLNMYQHLEHDLKNLEQTMNQIK